MGQYGLVSDRQMLQRLVRETAKSGFEPMFAATNRVKAAGHARRAVSPIGRVAPVFGPGDQMQRSA